MGERDAANVLIKRERAMVGKRERFSKRFNLERERGTDKHEREVGEKDKERETKLL